MDVVVCGSCKVSAFIIQLCSDLVHLHEVEKILYTSKLIGTCIKLQAETIFNHGEWKKFC